MSQGKKKFSNRGRAVVAKVDINDTNPNTKLNPCLGKIRYSEIPTSIDPTWNTTRFYYCVWCDGYHGTKQDGPKGSMNNRTKNRGRKKFD